MQASMIQELLAVLDQTATEHLSQSAHTKVLQDEHNDAYTFCRNWSSPQSCVHQSHFTKVSISELPLSSLVNKKFHWHRSNVERSLFHSLQSQSWTPLQITYVPRVSPAFY